MAPLASLAWCFAIAAVAGIFGLSPAFGAFLAGLIAGNSQQRELVHHNAGPIQAVLLMTFFLSIGLLIDLGFLWDNLGVVILFWLVVIVFKTLLNAGVLKLLGQDWQRAFLVALILGQVGEFAFVLGATALDVTLINSEVHRLIVSVTVLSLITSPIFIDAARYLSANPISETGKEAGLRVVLAYLYHRNLRILRYFYNTIRRFFRRIYQKTLDYRAWQKGRSAKRFMHVDNQQAHTAEEPDPMQDTSDGSQASSEESKA